MKNFKKYLILPFIFILLFIFIQINVIFAVDIDKDMSEQLDAFNKYADLLSGGSDPSSTLGEIVASVISGFLALLGVIFIILIILGGYKWMMARGNEDQVKEATESIRRAIIGLIIIIAAYAITYFVFRYLPWGTGYDIHEG